MQSNIAIDPALRSQTQSSPANSLSTGAHQGQYQPSSYSSVPPSSQQQYSSLQTPNFFGNIDHGAQDSPDQQSPHTPPVHNPDDLKRPRACEACRQLKVKCEFDDNSPNGTCKRCARANRQCIVTLPSRKRQKKTDSRVAELEKKVESLTAVLAAHGRQPGTEMLDATMAQRNFEQISPYTQPWTDQQQHMPQLTPHVLTPQVAGSKRKVGDSLFGEELHKVTTSPRKEQSSQVHDNKLPADVIDRGLIDLKTAYRCFDRYINDMSQRLPIVVFKNGTKAEEVRQSKPVLFQAIVGVAAGTIRPDLQSPILSDVTRILATKVIHGGEKSIELVQTLQVLTIFYQPPEKYEELNFNQLVHVAAVMALDLGLGKRVRKVGQIPWNGGKNKPKGMPDPNAAETRRCWLGCYYMCSISAMSLRRPLLVRWSPYADECVQILHTAPDALPSDRLLCHIAQAQHIAEMIGTEFAMDDSAQELSLTDPKVQYHLKALEKELDNWQKTGEEFMSNPIVRHTQAIVNLYMHEIAMHNNHNIDDFRPPYHSTPIEGPPDPESVTPVHIDSLTKCLGAAHAAFDAILAMDINTLRSLPTHLLVRNSYAAVAMIKLYTAIAAKGSKYGTIFQPDELKVEHYLDRLIMTLTKVAEGGMSRAAYKFSLIFQMLRSWHLKRTETPSGQSKEQPRAPSQPTTATQPKHSTSSKQDQMIQPSQPSVWQQPEIHGAPRSGLQMLSDAAINPSGQQIQGQWMPDQNQMVKQMQMSGHPVDINGLPMVIDPMMAAMYGMPPDQISLLDFTSDELMAYGFGDEFLAMNFGFDQGVGWGMQ